MLDENEIIKSAFNSDEETFKKCFDVLPEGAYEYYTEGMEWFNGSGEYGFKRGTEIMDNFFAGNIPLLSNRKNQIRELQSLKGQLKQLKSLSQEYESEKDFIGFKSRGVVDVLVLSMIVGIVCGLAIVLVIYLIK